MPSAENGMVLRDSMPAAMPRCRNPITVDVVLSSGVSRMPPVAQIAMKKKAQPARNINSVFAWRGSSTRSKARCIPSATGVRSTRQPISSASIAAPTSSSKFAHSTFSRLRGWPATSNAQNHLTWALASFAESAFVKKPSAAAPGSHLGRRYMNWPPHRIASRLTTPHVVNRYN